MIRQLSASSSNVVVKSSCVVEELKDPSLNTSSLPHFVMKNFLNPKLKDLVAIRDGSHPDDSVIGSITYKQVHSSTYSFAAALSKKFKVKTGDCVAIVGPNHIHYFSAFMGIGLTGAHSTCINPMYTTEEILHQLKSTNAKTIVTHMLCYEKVMEIKSKHIPDLNIIIMRHHHDPKADSTIDVEDLMTEYQTQYDCNDFATPADFNPKEVIFTIPFSSGTTGLSKGVVLTHHNLMSNTCQLFGGMRGMSASADGTRQRGTLLCPLPFFHIYGMVVGMCLPLILGAKLIPMAAFDMVKFLELIQNYKVTRALAVPPIIIGLAKHPIVDNYDLSSLEMLMSGAAPLGSDVQQACQQRIKGLKVIQGWGMTELSPVGTVIQEGEPNRMGSAGTLVSDTEGKIISSETGEDLPYMEEGEICIRGPQVMKGYLNNTAATEAMITKDGWLKSGDIGYFDKEGYMYVTDRMKELIKYKGFQVPPAELEAHLLSHPKIKDAIVIPVPDEEAGELPRAYCVLQDGVTATVEEVMEFINKKVAPHKKLRGGIRFVESVPKSPSGKLLRRIQVQMDRAQG